MTGPCGEVVEFAILGHFFYFLVFRKSCEPVPDVMSSYYKGVEEMIGARSLSCWESSERW